jgi:hypothetical protein
MRLIGRNLLLCVPHGNGACSCPSSAGHSVYRRVDNIGLAQIQSQLITTRKIQWQLQRKLLQRLLYPRKK